MASATAAGSIHVFSHPLRSNKTIFLFPSHLPNPTTKHRSFPEYSHALLARRRAPLAPCPSSSSGRIEPEDNEDGVQLGTMKLPQNTDLDRFETLLFQWANSLCQGANLPLPVPLKVDRVKGGARLGFTVVGDGKPETSVYIDCLVFPADASSDGVPMFRAIRNGPLKKNAPPGEPRIMRSLMQALQKSTEIARL